MWNKALSIKAPLVSITSFNEWHEGTQIETAVERKGYEDYGDPNLYLDITKEVIVVEMF